MVMFVSYCSVCVFIACLFYGYVGRSLHLLFIVRRLVNIYTALMPPRSLLKVARLPLFPARDPFLFVSGVSQGVLPSQQSFPVWLIGKNVKMLLKEVGGRMGKLFLCKKQ